MNELSMKCSIEGAEDDEDKIAVYVDSKPDENLLYKFIIGYNGTWSTLRDFGKENNTFWEPKENGRYSIMVQAKKQESGKPFDYVSRMDYVIRKTAEKLINEIKFNKPSFRIGEKVVITAEGSEKDLLYRFFVKAGNEWKLIKDYSTHNSVCCSAKVPGVQYVMTECKKSDSAREFDDFKESSFEVLTVKKPQIVKFQCLSSEITAGTSVLFQVDAASEEGRTTLFKFLKKNSEDKVEVIKDYTTNNIVSYTENKSGKYKLLCMAKDMYSEDAFDDRAIINYIVKPYKDIKIMSFTANLNSPQLFGTAVLFTSDVRGGKELVYRYVIDGNEAKDTGYTRNSGYEWHCAIPGSYKIKFFVKDVSCSKEYEDSASMDFVIDEKSREPACLEKIVCDKNRMVLKGETIHVKAIASGSMDLRYSFIIKKQGSIIEKIGYGTCSQFDFIPKEKGNYELEVRVKDKYSQREYDSHAVTTIEVFSYIPACIDYILLPKKDYFVSGEQIHLNVITQNTAKILFKYALKINGHKVEETDFVRTDKYLFTPKCKGLYTVEVFVRSKDSDKTFDAKEEVNIVVNGCLPITNTKIICDRKEVICNEPVNFTVSNEGGKEILYEFHLMELNEWNVVQKFSRKSFYTFIPYSIGRYKVLVLCKSSYSRSSYEDYDIMEFEVKAH